MPPTITAKISRSDLQTSDIPPLASITDVKHLSSYNWIEASNPTIAVPGSPALWSAPSVPQRLKKDAGLFYIAQNTARYPDSPLEPLFRALYITEPTFDIRATDVVTDRNNMRKLLSFIDPTSSKNGLEEFAMNVEITKNTALFDRIDPSTYEIIGPSEFRGFGHEFEKACTTDKIVGSTGHYRIVSYRFGGLNIVVRHETDGYVQARPSVQSPSSRGPANNDLASMLESLSLEPSDTRPGAALRGSQLIIRRDGQAVPISSTIEIKTRVAHKPLGISEVAPQIWVSQTPKLVRAYHQRGTFQVPIVEDVTTHIKKWEKDNQRHLKLLVVLIRRILHAAKNGGGSVTVRYDKRDDKLVVSKLLGKKMLPLDLYHKWDSSKETGVALN